MVNTSSEPRTVSATRRATYLNGLAALIVGIAIVTATSQAHHHYDPKAASGWRELPIYAISGLIGYGVAFGLGLLRARRSGTTKTTAWTALVLAVVGVVLFPVAWWTPIPFVFGAAAILLGVDANTAAGRSRLNTAAIGLGSLAILATVGLLAYRIVEALSH